MKHECPECGGDGFVPLEEDGGMVQHACYHCRTTGWVNYNPMLYRELGPNPSVDAINAELECCNEAE